MSKKNKLLIEISLLILISVVAWGYTVWQSQNAHRELIVEAGTVVEPSDFLKDSSIPASFTGNSKEIDIHKPGVYNVSVKTPYYLHRCTLFINDTVPPTATVTDLRIDYGNTAQATDFIRNINDETAVTVTYETEPDFKTAGLQTVSLLLTDLGKNTTVVNANLDICYVKKNAVYEASEKAPTVDAFLLRKCTASIESDLSNIDFSHIGTYNVDIKYNGMVYDSVLTVNDTIAPVLKLKDVAGFTQTVYPAECFTDSVTDNTDTTISFSREPDYTIAGDQEVIIVCRDEGGNATYEKAVLTLAEDTTPPVIEGVTDIKSYSGRQILYKENVTVTDNNPIGLNLDINIGNLDINVPGEYEITYIATDASGNVSTEISKVTIEGRNYSDTVVADYAADALSGVISPEMSAYDKVRAIYDYVENYLNWYSGSSLKLFWQQGAIDGFEEKKGDCFIYASVTQALLNAAGIPNMMIERSADSPAGGVHYWNLCDVGLGWQHLDTTPMNDGTEFFLWSDSEIKEYDNAHYKGYHQYDVTKYPSIK